MADSQASQYQLLLYIELTFSSLIGQKHTLNFSKSAPVWWPMGAIAKSTIVFLFSLYISVFLYVFFVLIDLIC